MNSKGRPNLIIWRREPEGAYHFVYDDRTEFVIAPDGGEVWCTSPESASVADTAVYLRGPVLGFVLRLRGVVCLHASAIAVDGSAMAIVGAGGAGKSTTAAAFVQLGFRLIAEDVAALRAVPFELQVLPGYPRLNLWPDAAQSLYGNANALPRLTPAGGVNDAWDKRYLDLDLDREFQSSPIRLAGVYVLGDREFGSELPRIEPLSAQDAFMELTDATYVNYALDASMRAHEFRTLGRLVRTISVRRVTPPADPARVPSLCAAMLADHREVASATLAVG